MDSYDILQIDNRFKEDILEKKKNIVKYKKLLKELEITLSKDNKDKIKRMIKNEYECLKKKISDLENDTKLNFYLLETTHIIEKYKTILRKPIKISFLGKKPKKNKEKDILVNKYLNIIKNYKDIIINNNEDNYKCENCENSENFNILENNIYICENCGSQKRMIKYISSYTDIERVNISAKYMYDRKIHFRDCINQYQGKQNSTIEKEVYKNLEKQFKLHHLLLENEKGYKKFKNITKQHVLIFLKDLGYSKHYENVHLIHYTLTGVKPDDISHIQNKLLNDFDTLTELYDKMFKKLKRKNFINTQYVLYQLLKRHRHPCNKEDFTILKTVDRKSFHDDICKKMFMKLGWNHTPFY